MELFVAGKNRVIINESDRVRSGGEGAVYRKGGTAYKIYSDPKKSIPAGKVAELSVLNRDYIARPLDMLLDSKGNPVGYTMKYLDNVYVLTQLFPKAFRIREGADPECMLRLVRSMQEGVEFVHQNGVLIVDLNEMNFLVSIDLKSVYFIDVNSYQTRSYPATAIMESIRDRQFRGTFSSLTDWFSFSVVSFMMFTGIHPYRGNHPVYGDDMNVRMEKNLSVLGKDVRIPPACLPLSVIPQTYLEWYRAVLEGGKRLPPPKEIQPMVVVVSPQVVFAGGSAFDIEEILDLPGDIVCYYDDIVATTQGVFLGKVPVAGAQSKGVMLGRAPKTRRAIAGWVGGGMVNFYDISLKVSIPVNLVAEQMMTSGGRFYVKQGISLLEVEMIELADKTLIGVKPVGNVTQNSSVLFDGVVIQDVLGTHYASIFPESGKCFQLKLPELDGHKIMDAKASGSVLAVVGSKSGRYNRFVFRFGPDYKSYGCRVVSDVPYRGVNFVCIENGICVLVGENDEVEVFSKSKDSSAVKVIKDSGIGDVHLASQGARALFWRGGKLYRFSMK